MKHFIKLVIIINIGLLSFLTFAGQDFRKICRQELTQEEEIIQKNDREIREPREVEMAIKLYELLESKDAELAIVGRVGSQISDRPFKYPNGNKWQITYTHAGFAIRDDRGWYFEHQLNTCAGPTSDLYIQNLLEFYQDKSLGENGEYLYRTEVFIPSKKIQKQIKKVLQTELRDSLHEKNYNKIAYPFSLIENTGPAYQNSNQWLLEVIAAAQMQIEGYFDIDRKSTQQYLKDNNYLPTVSKLSNKEIVFGVGFGVGSGRNTKFDDQPSGYDIKPIWVSVESIMEYLDNSDETVLRHTLCLGNKSGHSCPL